MFSINGRLVWLYGFILIIAFGMQLDWGWSQSKAMQNAFRDQIEKHLQTLTE